MSEYKVSIGEISAAREAVKDLPDDGVSGAFKRIIMGTTETIEAQHEALIKAKEAFEALNEMECAYCWGTKGNHATECQVNQALTAIEKVIV